MAIKDLWSKTTGWLQAHKLSGRTDYQPQVDNDGLISQENFGPAEQTVEKGPDQANQLAVKTVEPKDKSVSIEKLQAGFDKLIGQLQGINEHLNRQVVQHQELMGRIGQLPKLLESFPAVVENQKQLTERLFEQLKTTAAKDQQFVESIEKIPAETARQTDALVNIDHQLAAAADTDVQIAESFNKFNETLDKLNENSAGQTDSIMQMSKTFATSDRYLKYIITRDKKRFMWMFISTVGICVLAILILAGIIVYLRAVRI